MLVLAVAVEAVAFERENEAHNGIKIVMNDNFKKSQGGRGEGEGVGRGEG